MKKISLVVLFLGLVLGGRQSFAATGYYTRTGGPAAYDVCDALETDSGSAYAACALSVAITPHPECNEFAPGQEPYYVDFGSGSYRVSFQIKGYADAACTDYDALQGLSANISIASCESGTYEPEAGCPAQCDGTITGQVFWRPVFSADEAGNICSESTHCQMVPVDRTQLSDQAALVKFTGTSNGCAAGDPDTLVSAATQCVSSGGSTWCTEPDLAEENCGYYNDDFLCLGKVPDGNCVFFGNGDMACGSSATSPPAPDDGTTPGTVATPDGGISVSTATTDTDIDIFNSTTVANSLGGASGGHPGDGPGVGDEEASELDFSDILETPTAPTGVAEIGSIQDELEASFDAIEGDMVDPEDWSAPGLSLDDSIANVLTGEACSDVVIAAAGEFFPGVTLECSRLADLRSVLGWILRTTLAIVFFNYVTTRPQS